MSHTDFPDWMTEDPETRERIGLPPLTPITVTEHDSRIIRGALGAAGDAIGRAGRRLAEAFPTPPIPYAVPTSRRARALAFIKGHTYCRWDWGTWKIGMSFSRHSVSLSLLCLQVWATTYRTVHADDW